MLNNKELPVMMIFVITMWYTSSVMGNTPLFIISFGAWLFLFCLYFWNEVLRDEVKNRIISKFQEARISFTTILK